ncbi:unnamed protein product [Diabrotica balteata]|uniref:Uncharacterized protein n=1 Tax=Diabrotica balteata TaxID=107213 RepID=A0A9N9XBR2_DIABA|nr:unnamed protein product [Diabrotica balteata]
MASLLAKSFRAVCRNSSSLRSFSTRPLAVTLVNRCNDILQNSPQSKSCSLIDVQTRFYSPEVIKTKPSEDEIKQRVLKVCSSYDKVTAEKVPTYINIFYFRDSHHNREVTVLSHH